MKQPGKYSKTMLIAVERPPIHDTACYSVKDAAAHTTFCEKVILTAVDDGKLIACKTGNRIVILGKDLLAWLQASRLKEQAL